MRWSGVYWLRIIEIISGFFTTLFFFANYQNSKAYTHLLRVYVLSLVGSEREIWKTEDMCSKIFMPYGDF